MATFPKSINQILHDYQIELEEWVINATLEEIKEYLLLIHGLVYPDDWSQFIQQHLRDFGNQKDYISGCTSCQEIILAIHTISSTVRTDLKVLFSGVNE